MLDYQDVSAYALGTSREQQGDLDSEVLRILKRACVHLLDNSKCCFMTSKSSRYRRISTLFLSQQ